MSVLAQGPLYILSFLLIISVVVIVHELGHYWAGRIYNAGAESFAIGFGKPIYERTDSRGTRWRINWLPMGGFVKFVGEHQTPIDVGVVEEGPKGRVYNDLSVSARSVIAAAGPFANFVFSSLVFGILIFWLGVNTERITAQTIVEGSPAEAAGIQVGDQFIAANGKPIETLQDLYIVAQYSAGTPVNFELLRDGQALEIEITPRRTEITDQFGVKRSVGQIGVGPARMIISTDRVNPVEALVRGTAQTGEAISQTVRILWRLATGKESLNQLSGPLGIAKVAGSGTVQIVEVEDISVWQKARGLLIWFLSIAASISVAVGFFNLLPIPVLDGGHLVFNAVEAVTGRPPSEKIQQAVLSLGFALLITVALFVTWNDIRSTGLLEVFSGL